MKLVAILLLVADDWHRTCGRVTAPQIPAGASKPEDINCKKTFHYHRTSAPNIGAHVSYPYACAHAGNVLVKQKGCLDQAPVVDLLNLMQPCASATELPHTGETPGSHHLVSGSQRTWEMTLGYITGAGWGTCGH